MRNRLSYKIVRLDFWGDDLKVRFYHNDTYKLSNVTKFWHFFCFSSLETATAQTPNGKYFFPMKLANGGLRMYPRDEVWLKRAEVVPLKTALRTPELVFWETVRHARSQGLD